MKHRHVSEHAGGSRGFKKSSGKILTSLCAMRQQTDSQRLCALLYGSDGWWLLSAAEFVSAPQIVKHARSSRGCASAGYACPQRM